MVANQDIVSLIVWYFWHTCVSLWVLFCDIPERYTVDGSRWKWAMTIRMMVNDDDDDHHHDNGDDDDASDDDGNDNDDDDDDDFDCLQRRRWCGRGRS